MVPLNRRWLAGASLILLAAGALFLVRLGDRAVISEELRWAEVAREMQDTGDYFHPTINDQTYYDKPLGSYWLIVAASLLTGEVNETAARLPAAIFGILGVLLTMLLARHFYDDKTSLAAGMILATSFGFAFYSRRATADIETVTGVLAAVCLFAFRRAPGPWLIALWIIMAMTSLTKGLLGFALPIFVFAIEGTLAALTERGENQNRLVAILRGHRWFFNRWSLLAAPLGIAIYILPFVISAWETGAVDGLAMVWRENVQRFVAPHNHVGPVYLYVGVIFVLAAPWSVFLPAALMPLQEARLVRVYFWGVFLFFTLSASRRSYYLLPVLPPTAMLIARVLTATRDSMSPVVRRLRDLGWVLFFLAIASAGLALIPPAWLLPAPYDQLPELPARVPFAIGWIASLLALGGALRHSRRHLFAVAAAVVFAGFAYAFWIVLPAADNARTRRTFLAEVRSITEPAPARLAMFHARDAVFDFGRKIPDYATAGKLAEAMGRGEVRWVLTRRKNAEELSKMLTALPRVLAWEAEHPWENDAQRGDKLLLLEMGTKP